MMAYVSITVLNRECTVRRTFVRADPFFRTLADGTLGPLDGTNVDKQVVSA